MWKKQQLYIIASVFFLGVGVFILPAGVLIDRWSRKKTVAVLAMAWSAATIATGMAHNFIIMLVARFFCGSGEAGFQPGGTAWLSIVFPKEHRNKVNGIFFSGAIIGVIVGMAYGGYLVTTYNWRVAFLAFGIPGMLLGLLAMAVPILDTLTTIIRRRRRVGPRRLLHHQLRRRQALPGRHPEVRVVDR